MTVTHSTRLRAENGFVTIYVLALLVIALTLGAVGLAESLSSRSLTTRDGRVRRAQQAADAGVRRILYAEAETNISNWNMNGGPLGLSTVLDCLPLTLNSSSQITGLFTAGAYVNAAGVCPSTSSANQDYTDALGNHAFEQAEFIPGQVNFLGGAERQYFPKIVALGWDDNGSNKVYSRKEVILAPIAPLQAIEGMNNVTINGLSALGLGAVVVNGDLVAHGTLTLPSVYVGANLATTSGSILATVAAPTINGSIVSTVNGGTVNASQIIMRPPVIISASKPNCSSAPGCAALGSYYSGNTPLDTKNVFSMTSGSVTFQPGDYVFCDFSVTGGTVNVNPSSSAPVRIFIDNPNSTRCKSPNGVSPEGNFKATTGINNLLSGATAPSGLQIYLVGDGGGYDNATTVNIGVTTTCKTFLLGVCVAANTPATQSMVLYAPTSAVTVDTGACVIAGVCAAGDYSGALVGDNVTIRAGTITEDLDLGNYPLYVGVNVFRPIQHIECSNSITSLDGLKSSATAIDLAHDTSGC
jgi:Tfp pilus assembly protein PilX